MSVPKKPVYVGGGLALLFVAIGVFLPSRAVVERETTIDAPRATVFALLNDFRQVNKWSPWLKPDPNVRVDITGPRRGVGATLSWDGNIIGSGGQTITASEPHERVVTRMSQGDSDDLVTATFELEETDTGTHVTWRLEADFGRNLAGRYYGLMLDNIFGDELDGGLAELAILAESLPPHDFSDLEVEHIDVGATDIAYMPASSEPLAAAISDALGDAYFQILNFIDRHGLTDAGAPISISRAYSGAELRFDAGIPVKGITGDTPREDGQVRLGRTYGGRVIRVRHMGSYLDLARTHDKIVAYLAALGLERNGDAWESYVSDPTKTPEDELLTYVYYPVRDDN